MAHKVEFITKNGEIQESYVRTSELEANELCDSLNKNNLFPDIGHWELKSL